MRGSLSSTKLYLQVLKGAIEKGVIIYSILLLPYMDENVTFSSTAKQAWSESEVLFYVAQLYLLNLGARYREKNASSIFVKESIWGYEQENGNITSCTNKLQSFFFSGDLPPFLIKICKARRLQLF